jgi:uncharacterized membrane protein
MPSGRSSGAITNGTIGRGRSRSLLFRRPLGLGFIFLWFAIGGVAHFAATDTEMRIVPSYIPWPHAVVLISGVFELLGAAGCFIGRPEARPASAYSF